MGRQPETLLSTDLADDDAAEAAHDLAGPAPSPGARLIPAIIGTAMFMSNLSSTSISTALPSMAPALHVEPLRLNIVITAYLLGLTGFLPISGWIADRFGAKRVLMLAMILFTLASAACGFAPNLTILVLCRVVQGCAGAMMTPVGRLVLLRNTPKHELVGAMSMLTVPAMIGPVVGPLLGGAVVSVASWRWVFFLNLPVAVASVALVRAFVPDVKERAVAPLDWIGVTLLALTLGGLIFGVDTLGHGKSEWPLIALLFALGTGSLIAYGFHARRSAHPIIDPAIFNTPTFTASVVGGSFFRLMAGATPFLLAMLLQVSFGMTPLAAGLMTFVSAVGSLVMKIAAPPILRRWGFRTVLIANALICAASFMACSLFTIQTAHWLVAGVLGIGGFFRSLQFTSINGMAYADLGEDEMSRGTSASAMISQFVQSVSVGMAALLLAATMHWRGETHLTAGTVTPAFTVIALLTLLSIPWFARLPADAGSSMTTRAR